MEDTKQRTMFIATLSFYEQHSGPMRILARDEAHVRELIPQMYPQLKDLTILDIVEEKNVRLPEPVMGDDEDDEPKKIH